MEVVELDRSDADEVLALYREYGWWDDRSRGAVERALSNTPLALGIRDDGNDGGRSGVRNDGRDGDRNDGRDGDRNDGHSGERDDELVASARILTDFTFYARVYDVVVAADRRREGIGEQLMAAVTAHPALSGTNVVLLCREGLVEFYEGCGFEPYPDAVDVPEGGREELHQQFYRLNASSADEEA